jgi:hypothetical protein
MHSATGSTAAFTEVLLGGEANHRFLSIAYQTSKAYSKRIIRVKKSGTVINVQIRWV